MRLLLLHGFTGGPASWSGVLARLPGSARALTPSLLGHAGSDSGARTFDEEVERIAARVPRGHAVHLGGYSLGARIGLALLVRHADRFSGATLIGAHPGLPTPAERAERTRADQRWIDLLHGAHPGLPTPAERAERTRADQRWIDLLQGEATDAPGAIDRFLDAWLAQPLFASQARLPPSLRADSRAARSAHTAAGLARALAVLGRGAMPDLTPALAALPTPLHLLSGSEDPACLAAARTIAARARRATVEIVAGAGHDLLLERPDAVAHALLRSVETPFVEAAP